MSATYRDESRKGWYSPDENPTTDQLKLGCLQRIADATEAMAKSHTRLMEERDRFERWYREERARAERLERSNRALKAWNTRYKRKSC